MATDIPHPPGLPILGNLRDIDPEVPIASLDKLSETYGSIFSISTFGSRRVIVASASLMAEICDEKRFHKVVSQGLGEVRNGTHDGLFTAHMGEHNWELAHRILVPAFGPLNIRAMFADMRDIATQLVLKWARHGSDYKIPVTEDFTRLTLDTLALCSMDYRFNSFYQEQMHPFVDAMVSFLSESGNRVRRPGFLAAFWRREEYQYWKDIEYMRKLSLELVQTRKDHPEPDKKDLLNAMLHGKDPKTGEALSEDSIVDNMITFLIAGHETTSGLLSFAFQYLVKSPDAYKKAQEEVDRVIGKAPIEVEHLTKLPYLNAVLRESLRLSPTAPAYAVAPNNDVEVLGGQYTVYKDEPIVALLTKIQRDPEVYEDPDEFRPERMLDEKFNQLPPGAWKPFGNGARGCIGRPFAWQEALIVTAMLLQYFDFALDDPNYTLHIKQTLTIKPKDLLMRAKLRHGLTATQLERGLSSSLSGSEPISDKTGAVQQSDSSTPLGKPMTVLYGSNTGTCQAFAQKLAANAPAHGFHASRVDTLDSAKDALPTDQPVVIITASYEGQPCDNAAHFFDWLESVKEEEEMKVSYAVFGAGHSDWKSTFHRIPSAIDDMLAAHKGDRICKRGGADAAQGDMFSDFEAWEDTFWSAMSDRYGASDAAAPAKSVTVQVSNLRSSYLRADVSEAKVIDTRLLTAPGAPEKRHIEIQLPSNMSYRTGDYLAILPLNPDEIVQRALRCFHLPWDSVLTISAGSGTILPTGVPISAHDLFSAYVELSQPATKRNVTMLADACTDASTKTKLTELSNNSYQAEVNDKRISLLDLLDRFPNVHLPLGSFLASLPPMRTRQYSISSSPLRDPTRLTLTYAVLRQPHTSGTGTYVGVASNYLSKLAAGDSLHVSVRPSNQAFHLPSAANDADNDANDDSDAEHTPVIMVAAGTGLAPFRGFVQERAAQIGAGRKLAPALLVVGCRAPDVDELYRDEFDRWEQMGAVRVLRAYSRTPEASHGHKYVQDVIWDHRAEINTLWAEGSKVFVCGSRALELSVRAVSKKIYLARAKELGKDVDEDGAEKWFEDIKFSRFATDVFT